MILPTTFVLASDSLDANFLSSLRTARTSSNVTLPPTFPSSFSTRIVFPGSARYCFPPLRITAYILPPEACDKPQLYWIQGTSVNALSAWFDANACGKQGASHQRRSSIVS